MAETNYLTIGPVAAQVGVPRWRLAYLIEHGNVPGPSFQVPGRRLFTEADVQQIRQALMTKAASHATRRRPQLSEMS
jgi:DNA-binding transcriptional MerR regulator